MKLRVVLDANIYASALMKPDGLPAKILLEIVEGTLFELVLSQAILDELKRILFYPKIRSRITKTDVEISAWLDALGLISHFVEPRYSYPVLVEEDPDDDIYLIAAFEGLAKYLISGDQHLLKIQAYEKVRIVTASWFLQEHFKK